MLTKEIEKRLGFGLDGGKSVKSHPFFKDINWEQLEARAIEPPNKPKVIPKINIKNVVAGAQTAYSLIDSNISQIMEPFNLLHLPTNIVKEVYFIAFFYFNLKI